MSVIYGIVMLNGQPVNPAMLENMKKALEFTNPDIQGIWQDGNVAIGSLTKFDTPESFKEKQPIFFEDDRKVMVVNARIDNRDDLCRIFNIPLIYRDNYPDSHYIKLAYEKWGDNCPDHLLGDWSFAVYDKTLKKMYVARDHCGIMALYYYSSPDFFAFSSSPKGLLTLKEIPKELNEFRLAQILVAWPGDGEQTCYQHIFNLLPGHYLTLQDKKLQKTKYWELTEQEDLILPKEQDYYDRFLEIFTEAVRCRLRTTKNVGISLSGGLDSTSVAAIAAIELAKQNKELYAFTSVPLYKNCKVPKGRNGDEGELAGLMAKKYPNIRHFLVNAEGYDPIECIKKAVEIHDEPMHAAANQYWIQAINDKAKEVEINILLNGQGGNSVISWPTGRVKMFSQGGMKFYKYKIRETIVSIQDYLFNKEVYKYPFLKYSEINPEFAKNLDLINKMKIYDHDPGFGKFETFKSAQKKLIYRTTKNAYQFHLQKSLWYGIHSLDPYGCKRLIEYSVSVKTSLYRENNYEKIFVKKGMKKFLPEEILISSVKGRQASDLINRFDNKPESGIIDFQDNSILNNLLTISESSTFKDFNRYPTTIATIFFIKNICQKWTN